MTPSSGLRLRELLVDCWVRQASWRGLIASAFQRFYGRCWKACSDFFVFDEEVTPDLNVSLSLPVGIHFAKNWYRGVGLHVADAGGRVRKEPSLHF